MGRLTGTSKVKFCTKGVWGGSVSLTNTWTVALPPPPMRISRPIRLTVMSAWVRLTATRRVEPIS